jgi:hypothetical protein
VLATLEEPKDAADPLSQVRLAPARTSMPVLSELTQDPGGSLSRGDRPLS